MPDALVQALLGAGHALQAADVALFRLINGDCAHPALDLLMALITQLGLGTVQLALMALFYTFGGPVGRRVTLICFLAYLVGGVAAQILKYGADRPRPALVVEECRFVCEVLRFRSFPSGHTVTSFAIAVVAGATYRRWAAPLLIVAGLVGLSRVYIGVHFPGDVLAGALVGIATGIACLHEVPLAGKTAPPPPRGDDDRAADEVRIAEPAVVCGLHAAGEPDPRDLRA